MEARGGPRGKAWSEEEGARAAQHAGRSFGEKFKFLIWLSIVAALVSLLQKWLGVHASLGGVGAATGPRCRGRLRHALPFLMAVPRRLLLAWACQ